MHRQELLKIQYCKYQINGEVIEKRNSEEICRALRSF